MSKVAVKTQDITEDYDLKSDLGNSNFNLKLTLLGYMSFFRYRISYNHNRVRDTGRERFTLLRAFFFSFLVMWLCEHLINQRVESILNIAPLPLALPLDLFLWFMFQWIITKMFLFSLLRWKWKYDFF